MNLHCIAFKVVTYGQLEQDCLGAWCPVRRIPGLILIHAWNPNDMNTLTSVCALLFIISYMISCILNCNHHHNFIILIISQCKLQIQDHVKCHFVRPAVDSVSGGGREEVAEKSKKVFQSFQVLQSEVLYTVREGGELSEGETHWLTQNNPVLLPTGQAMMMTLDCGVLCGQVYDGLDSVGHCPHHSSR